MKQLLLSLLISPVICMGQFLYLGPYDTQGVPFYLESPDEVSSQLLTDIQYALPNGRSVPANNPGLLSDTAVINTVVADSVDLYVTFVNEGAGYKNTLGYFTFPTDNPPNTAEDLGPLTYIFPNASRSGAGGGLVAGDKVYLGTFPPGVTVGYFLVANGWNANSQAVVPAGHWVHYSIPAFNLGGMQQSVLLHHENAGLDVLGFEDIARTSGGDQDFEDCLFYVTATPPEAVDNDGVIDIETAWVANEEQDQPETPTLLQAWPNPFNPSTTISFQLAETQEIRVSAYDITGKEVAVIAEGLAAAGENQLHFNAESLPSGVYLVALECEQGRQVQRVTLLR